MENRVPEEYAQLRAEYLIIRKELEVAKQIQHENSREIKRLQALEHDYEAELELLQKESNKIAEHYNEKVSQLEQSVIATKESCNKKLQELEDELSIKNDEVLKLQAECEVLKVTCVKEEKDDTDDLQDENELLISSIDELKEQIRIKDQHCFDMEQKLKESMKDIEMYKDIIADKSRDMEEVQNLKEKLTEEVFELRQELETAKTQSLGANAKGNSLFAEVDDRRVHIQTVMKNMKSEYLSMKEKYTKLSQTLKHLQIEHARLLDNRRTELMEFQYDEDTRMKAYKSRVKELEYLVKSYKSDLELKSSEDLVTDTSNYYYKLTKEKGKKIEELRERLNSRSLTDTLMAMALSKANDEKRKWQLEATLKDHLLQLKEDAPASSDDIEEIRKRLAMELDNLTINPNSSSEYVTNVHSSVVRKSELKEDIEGLSNHKQEGITVKTSLNSLQILSDTGKSNYSTSAVPNYSKETVEDTENKENSPEQVKENSNITRRVKFMSNTTSPVPSNSKKRHGIIVYTKPAHICD